VVPRPSKLNSCRIQRNGISWVIRATELHRRRGTCEGRAAMSSKITTFCVAAILVNSNPAEAHDLYSQLVDKWGALCCNETDCRPARFRVTPKGVEMFVAGRWARVPTEHIQYRTLAGDTGETGGGHWCGQADWGYDGSGGVDVYWVTRCAILPPNFSSLPAPVQ
jgi:hypothetical protein